MGDININGNSGPVSVTVNEQPQANPVAGWAILFVLLCNPWSVLILGVIFFSIVDKIGAGTLVLLVFGTMLLAAFAQRSKRERRERERLSTCADIEHAWYLEGDPRGTYGHYPPAVNTEGLI